MKITKDILYLLIKEITFPCFLEIFLLHMYKLIRIGKKKYDFINILFFYNKNRLLSNGSGLFKYKLWIIHSVDIKGIFNCFIF